MRKVNYNSCSLYDASCNRKTGSTQSGQMAQAADWRIVLRRKIRTENHGNKRPLGTRLADEQRYSRHDGLVNKWDPGAELVNNSSWFDLGIDLLCNELDRWEKKELDGENTKWLGFKNVQHSRFDAQEIKNWMLGHYAGNWKKVYGNSEIRELMSVNRCR